MKKNSSLITCPVCSSNLEIREYYCTQCHTTVRGRFAIDMFAGLSESQLEFIKIFLVSQGNIKEMEKRLNISYPTVKSRLADIIEVIAPQEKQTQNYVDLLEQIEKGNLTVDEVVNQINQRRNKE
ncbi:MAG TPA: DUF2089 domain-containing protein [Candidatus Cloacimonadota bacterium]|nr:DUF2089 domain-containing protein [Candidatus Cloacimonadota bacterium]HPT71424.1 DUF2089 domain-containing protein [Candidatus Cloacimonadota bacterium]